MTLYKGTTPIAGLSTNKIVTGFNILDCKWSDHIINDIQWLRADTFSWQSGNVYTTAYNKLVEEYSKEASTTESEFYGNLTNVATQSNSISSGDQNNDEKEKAFDNTISNYWASAQLGSSNIINTAYIGQQNLTKIISKIRIYQGHASQTTNYCTSFKIQYSNNGTTWNDIQEVTNGVDKTWQEINLQEYNPDLTGYSLRLLASGGFSGSTSNGWVVDELELYAYDNYITFKRTSNGFKIADASQESTILSKYNTDGIAWYYILDTENRRFKLPRTKFGFEGIRNTVGDDITESLPNINGSVASEVNFVRNGQGVFSTDNTYTSTMGSQSGSLYSLQRNLSFDASRSSSTYKNGAPVQERATQMYLYFYVGEYTQSAIEQTAGITSEQLNAKVDTSSLSEINPMIESYVNGTSGYNIWANGYCEQWGTKDSGTSRPVINSFLKKFNDTNYCVTIADCCINSYANMYVTWVYKKTVDSFTYYYNGGGSGATSQYSLSWKASGYLAEGEY